MLLQAIAEQPEEALRQGLLRLLEAEFLYETQLFPDLEYTFKHALTHEAAYSSLLQERRQMLHTRIVEAIEAQHSGRLDDHVERLADHAERAGLWNKALAYRRASGDRAAGRSANREAVVHYEQALAALGRVPTNLELTQQAIDLRIRLREVLFALGRPDRALEYLNQAEALAESAADPECLARILCFQVFWSGPTENMNVRLPCVSVFGRWPSATNDISLEAPARDIQGRATTSWFSSSSGRRASGERRPPSGPPPRTVRHGHLRFRGISLFSGPFQGRDRRICRRIWMRPGG